MKLSFAHDDHRSVGLSRNPFKALVAPRPIGWISTRSETGIDNLAPYSFFNAISDTPPIVCFSSGGHKDSAANAIATGVFAVNLVSAALAEAMNMTSASVGPEVSEFDLAGLDREECEDIAVSSVRLAPAVLECRVTDHFHPRGLDGPSQSIVVLGQVVRIRIAEDHVRDGLFDNRKAALVARLGYMDYSASDEVFEMQRPKL